MAHFAQLDSNNVVTQVIVVGNDDITDSNGVETESIGISFCQKVVGGDSWKQTSYNSNMRGNYAGVGFTYMTNVATLGVGSTDIFIEPQPHASWTIGVSTASWYAPITKPTLSPEEEEAGKYYTWEESAYQADNTKGWIVSDSVS